MSITGATIEKLTAEESDTFVLTLTEDLDNEQLQGLVDFLGNRFPGVGFLCLMPGQQLGTVTADDQRALLLDILEEADVANPAPAHAIRKIRSLALRSLGLTDDTGLTFTNDDRHDPT